ncbi:organic solvent tolerance protein OstA [Pseudomonas sp. 2822-15]|jgi:lipopolysaccharide export system protein LptA|uniref:Lipopolysaccharide export system protein LptA n=1 Tax=Pseudomonas salomonii TaxID=191391 RepID=A0A1H3CPQ8_9PSED|nr:MULTISPECIES: lipopolysaccharide transport periplasmic protein LptA [Pseudomonas]MDQ0706044.1 lipopolysaccharide export system protein LptA [Pseudomonas sp. W3I7]NWF09073.1 lipopolysaccharide transport periplasmic protein LptA [Pseudomonas salomonii]PIB46664.1 organic solvent tolerance protein OstA [Pseudomonas sp. 2822-15]WLH85723.1 lipopolysaccharide transport periplasmic protein LptA [Pseudomonas sp. FP2338]CRM53391.1 Lipopolysaccharide export system protein LptA precursor [Pseudomonas s
MRLVKTLPILLGLGAALGSVSAWALPNDSQQPIRIQADDAQLDDKQGVATYSGGVVIIQGSMKITGNTVTLTRTPAGDIDVVTSVGNLAYFEQMQSVTDKKPMQGYGKTIQYHAQQNRIVLIDQARVVSTDGNTTEGEKITYDTVKQIATAGRANGSKVTQPRPRIDMVIQPKQKDAAAPAPKPAAKKTN